MVRVFNKMNLTLPTLPDIFAGWFPIPIFFSCYLRTPLILIVVYFSLYLYSIKYYIPIVGKTLRSTVAYACNYGNSISYQPF